MSGERGKPTLTRIASAYTQIVIYKLHSRGQGMTWSFTFSDAASALSSSIHLMCCNEFLNVSTMSDQRHEALGRVADTRRFAYQ